MTKFLPILLLLPASAQASVPAYKLKLTSTFCTPAERLNAATQSCEDNGVFLSQAKSCWDTLQKLQNQVSTDLTSAMKRNAATNQNQDQSSNAANNADAVLAHTFMIQATKTAIQNLDKYYDFVVYPEDANTNVEVMNTQCYHDTVVPMDQISEKMEKKLAALEASRNEEAANGATSTGNHEAGTKMSGTGAIVDSRAAKGVGHGSVKAGSTPDSRSDVTGLKQDELKQNQR